MRGYLVRELCIISCVGVFLCPADHVTVTSLSDHYLLAREHAPALVMHLSATSNTHKTATVFFA